MRGPHLKSWSNRVPAPLLACLLLAGLGGPASADRWQLAGEAQVAGVATVASANQLGPAPDETGACGQRPTGDIGLGFAGTGAALLSTPRYRYQLGVTLGYYAMLCTPSLRRWVAGLNFRGEHHLGERTVFTSTVHMVVDAFDRSLDIQTGNLNPNMSQLPQMNTRLQGPDLSLSGVVPTDTKLLAGTPYLTGNASLELDQRFAGRYGIHGELGLQMLELFSPVSDVYISLGPMEIVELGVSPFRDTVRERIELPVRYRVSHFYSGSLIDIKPRGQVNPSQDISVRGVWERRFSPLLSLRLGGGLALAYQPNLCEELGADYVAGDLCSVDHRAPGIRGADGAPPLEFTIGRRTTGTFVADATLRYQNRRQLYELQFERAYEPNPYASALALSNRLAGNLLVRLTQDLTVLSTVQFLEQSFTSLGRDDVLQGQKVSPQNRTLWSSVGSLGLDWAFHGPLSLFVQVDWQAFAIRGERVPNTTDPDHPVPEFPPSTRPSPDPGRPDIPTGDRYLSAERLTFLLGLRIARRPSPREADLLRTARAIE